MATLTEVDQGSDLRAFPFHTLVNKKGNWGKSKKNEKKLYVASSRVSFSLCC